jgi:arginine decarboxylase
MRATDLALRIRRQVNGNPAYLRSISACSRPNEMVPATYRESGLGDYGPPHCNWQEMASAWDTDEIALDPTRLTLVCGTAGYDGTAFKGLLAERYDIQLNKTSRNSILLQTNINNTRSDVAHLIRVLAEIAHDIDKQLRRGGGERRAPSSRRG